VRTCNCIYAMIQQRQRDIEYRETANETRQRCLQKLVILRYFHVLLKMYGKFGAPILRLECTDMSVFWRIPKN
jgi:hypothetical protein